MSMNLFPDLVACAARILGGERQLARYLGSDSAEVQQWLRGASNPPARVHRRLSGLLARNVEEYAESRPRGFSVPSWSAD